MYHNDDDDHLVDCHDVPAVSEDGVEVEPGAGQDAGGVVDAEHRLLQVWWQHRVMLIKDGTWNIQTMFIN